MKLYLIRHGEAVSNRDRIFGGQGQIPLTETGKLQAEALRSYIGNIHFDRIYSSDLIRAINTMDLALPSHPEATVTTLLRERSVGSLTGRPTSSITEEERALLKAHGFSYFGGEEIEYVKERIKLFLSEIETLPEDEVVAAFCHQGILTHALAVIFNADISWQNVVVGNCAVMILNYNDGLWRLEGLINSTERILLEEQI